MKVRTGSVLLVFVAACATTEPNPRDTVADNPRIANLERAAALPWTDEGQCVVQEASQPWEEVAARCIHALDRRKVRFQDPERKCSVAAVGAVAVPVMVATCLLAQPVVVGAVIVIGTVMVAAAVKAELDEHARRRRADREAEASRQAERPGPTTRPSPEKEPSANRGPVPVPQPIPDTAEIPFARPKDRICDDETYDALGHQYKRLCKESGPMSCSRSSLGRRQYAELQCPEAVERLAKQEACLHARLSIQRECFGSIDARHLVPLEEHARGVENCRQAVGEKCRSP